MLNKLVRWGWVFLILLVQNGCATFSADRKPEDIVRQRINDRWQALLENRMETAYSYEMPEYRKLYSFSEYSKRTQGAGIRRKMEIERIHCKENKCSAELQIYVTIEFGLGFDSVETHGLATEIWTRDSATGQWYHVSDH